MQNASFNTQINCCVDKNKQAPIIGQSSYSLANNSFSTGITQTPFPLFTPLTAGDTAYASGHINNDSCYDLSCSITYLNKQNCTDCGTPSYVRVTKTFYVYANTLTELPEGYIVDLNINVGSMGAANVFSNLTNTTPINIEWTSSYNPDCNNPITVPA